MADYLGDIVYYLMLLLSLLAAFSAGWVARGTRRNR